jgi:hypothetical protein
MIDNVGLYMTNNYSWEISQENKMVYINVILEMFEKKEYITCNLQKDIYPIISKIFHKSAHNIKCNINNATEAMYYNCNISTLKEYFGFYEDIKPTVKTVIYTVLNKIS